MRHYELMVILDPNLDERTVTPSLETFLRVVRNDGGTVEKVEVWGKRRMAYEILKHAEGIYAVLDVTCEPATVAELDRQLSLNESVLRTKVMRVEVRKRQLANRASAPAGTSAAAAVSAPAAAATATPAATPATVTPAAAPVPVPAPAGRAEAPGPVPTPPRTAGDEPR
jgi:small subunit ribosomal protein S6